MGVGSDMAVVEDIAVGHILWGGGGSDIGFCLAEDVTVLKPSGGGTEDKVGRPLDIAVLEIVTTFGITSIDGVLMSEETAVDEGQPVAFRMQGDSLSQSGSVILDGDILQGDAISLDLEGIGTESTHPLTGRCIDDIRMIIPCDDGVVTILTAYLDIRQPLWDDEFLLIGAFLDKDDFMILHKGTAYLDSVSDVAELPCTVTCHDEGIGIVIVVGSLCMDDGQ